MKTEKMAGYFNVRKFEQKVAMRDRKILNDGENILFKTSFPINELPTIFVNDGAPKSAKHAYVSKSEERAATAEGREAKQDRISLTFKIGKSTAWFDKYGKACERPKNADLDSKQFDVRIDFRLKEKDPDDRKASCGYWVNAIMIREREANPFADEAFEESVEPQQEPEAEGSEKAEGEEKLPF